MPDQNTHTETKCWTCIKNDDPRGLGQLYDAYVDKLFISAMIFSSDRELSKDAIQDVFIQVWNYRKTIGDITNTQAYLTRILRRILVKKIKNNQSTVYLEDAASVLTSTQNTVERIIYSETKTEEMSRLRHAVASLTKRQREIIELRFFQGLTYDQIANRMGMNYQSVNNLAFRTFRRLREAMSPVILLILLLS